MTTRRPNVSVSSRKPRTSRRDSSDEPRRSSNTGSRIAPARLRRSDENESDERASTFAPEFVELSDTSAVGISLTTFKGKTYVDIRKFYSTSEDPNWKPTPKGVSVPLSHFNKVYQKLRRLKLYLQEQ